MLLNALSNGLGGQSMYLLWLAGQGRIPARVSITADTGSENDCLLNDGSKITAPDFWREFVKPLADKWGIDARFVRSVDENKKPLPSLWDDVTAAAAAQDVPLFGSDGGRLRQSCTDKWKARAIKQEARRMGATHLRSAIGFHFGEAERRIRGRWLRVWDGWDLYQTTNGQTEIKWMTHYYPCVDLKLGRHAIREQLDALGIPYLLTSECDHCPHKDAFRWLSSSQATIDAVAAQEAKYGGAFFFTERRIPLKMAIEQMRQERANSLFDSEPDFGCTNSYCGI